MASITEVSEKSAKNHSSLTSKIQAANQAAMGYKVSYRPINNAHPSNKASVRQQPSQLNIKQITPCPADLKGSPLHSPKRKMVYAGLIPPGEDKDGSKSSTKMDQL